jgi:hypothetical protein
VKEGIGHHFATLDMPEESQSFQRQSARRIFAMFKFFSRERFFFFLAGVYNLLTASTLD